MTDPDAATVELTLDRRGVDLERTLSVLRMLAGDPTVHLEPGRLVRATLTPRGGAVVDARWRPEGDTVVVRTIGAGAEWLAERAERLLGLHDDAAGFDPPDGPLRLAWRRHRAVRVPSTCTVRHDLCWAVVQQRVRRQDAARQWSRLVTRFGERAPGGIDLVLPPSAERLAAVPTYDLQALGLERRRAETLLRVARSPMDLDGLADLTIAEAEPVLRSLVGVGPWTTSLLTAVTWGDPDAVIVGDSGIPSMVAQLLTGERRADDNRMLELLEPYVGHRYRVVKLAFLHRTTRGRGHRRPA